MKMMLFAVCSSISCIVLADPSLSVTSVRALWPFSKRVEVGYRLDGASTPIDVQVHVTADGAVEFDVPDSALGGDCRSVTSGDHKLTFDPSRIPAVASRGVLTGIEVTLSPGMEKLYMLVDLSAGIGDTSTRISYTNEVVGVTPGVWDDYYKTNAIALRRIKAGSFTMGWNQSGSDSEKPAHGVTLTHDFYIGVFELTQGQAKKFFYQYPISNNDTVFVNPADCDLRPATHIRYYTMRGSSWQPGDTLETALDVEIGSPGFSAAHSLHRLRRLTGNSVPFDLPTEAQWEYACRAGATTELYDGHGISPSAEADTNLDRLGRYKCNGGLVKDGNSYTSPRRDISAEEGGTAVVGTYEPNAWGLYDMLGNVAEWCLDMYDGEYYDDTPVVDPRGGISANDDGTFNRTFRGGDWTSPAKECRASYRDGTKHGNSAEYLGCRICVTLR